MKKTLLFIIFFSGIIAVNLFAQYEDDSNVQERNSDFYQEMTETTAESYNNNEISIEEPQKQKLAVQPTQPPVVSSTQTQPVQQTQTNTQPVQQYTAAGNQNITPLTWELVNLIQNSGKSLNELYYFVSRSFTMVISEQYDNPRIDIQNGALIMQDMGNSSTIVFNSNLAGRLHGFPVSGSIDIFEVIFRIENKDIALKFKRNRQNFFELFSAVIDTRPYMLHSDTELPQLAISSNINTANQDVQAFPSSGRSTTVEGRGSLDKNRIIAYIKAQNSSVMKDAEKLIDIYIEEAAFENINHDIAIAQMLHATNFLKNQQRVSSHNYAGLIELPNWNGRFANMTEGVRAHIQHIKGYASSTLNRQQIVDPRYYILVNLRYLGTVKTFDQLYEKWTANPANYRKNIEKILDGLFQKN
jgi:hypothetical protein